MANKNAVAKEGFNEILLYTTPNGKVKVEIFLQNETIWLNQQKIAELFGVDRTVVTKHLNKIFIDGELQKDATCAKIAHVQKEGQREVTRLVEFYNLDAIISVGYRVNSTQATHFRIWATNLQFNEKSILKDTGKVSHQVALALAEKEFNKYSIVQDRLIESDFDMILKKKKALQQTEVKFYDPVFDPGTKLTYSVISAKFKDKWIFVRHNKRITWEIAGGHIEEGETSFEAAGRELKEETGALKFDLVCIATYSVKKDGETGWGRLYLANVTELGPIPDMSEIAEIAILDKLPENPTHPDIQPHLFRKTLEFIG